MAYEAAATAGPVAGLIRNHDWSRTGLGPRAAWSPAVRTVVDLMLRSRTAMAAMFGADGVLLYNDAYAAIIGARHPAALGAPVLEALPEVAAINRRVLEVGLAGGALSLHDESFTLDGDTRWFDVEYSPVVDDAGVSLGVFAIVTDTTARVRAQRGFASSESRLRTVLDMLPVGVLIAGPGGRVVDGNRHAEQLLGHEVLAVEGAGAPRAWIAYDENGQRIGPAELPLHVAAMQGLRSQRDMHYLRGDGTRAWLRVIGAPIRSSVGAVIGGLVTIIDIDHERRSSDALRNAERQQAAILHGHGDIFYGFDKNLRFTFFNSAAEKFFRMKRDDVVGRHRSEVFKSLIGSPFDAVFNRVLRTGEPERFEAESLWREGHWIDMRVFPTQQGLGVGITDVTNRRMAEAAVRDSERRLRALVETLPQMVWSTSPDGQCNYLSPQWVAYTGLPEEQQLGLRWLDCVVHPDDRERTREHWLGAVAGRHDYDIEYRIRRYDGEWRWFKARAIAVRGEDGEVGTWFGSCTDIQDMVWARERQSDLRQELELAVERSTRERDRIWNVSKDLLLVADLSSRFLDVNPAWTEVLGYTREELLGRTAEWLEHPEDSGRLRTARARLSSVGHIDGFEGRYRDRAGNTRWISWSAVAEDGRLYCRGRDMTAEKTAAAELEVAQAQLRQAQKMEAIGQLTGGIAHDFNNLLASILSSLQLAQRLHDRPQEVRHFTGMAMSSVQRAAALTQRLLAFGRRQALELRPVDVDGLIGSMEELLNRTLGETILVSTRLAPGLGPALADQNQLESALLNLVINARDAMPAGGRLSIETAAAQLDEQDTAGHAGVLPGDYLAIHVTDTGIGMPPEIMEKAFDPFFTTKPLGQGTGLGLSMIYGFLKQIGGHVQMRSAVGSGTTVSLYLRRSQAAVESAVPAEDPQTPRARSGEIILLVEDNEDLRALSCRILDELGYGVIEADSSEAALEVLERGERVDLLATDVGLPGLNGRQLAEIARQRRPDLRVLFITGYAEGASGRNRFLEPGMEMLMKPFTIDSLAGKVRAILSR